MAKIIIKGKFNIETDDGRMKGFQQPLEYLELNLMMPIPYRIDAMRTSQTKPKRNNG